MTSRKRAKSPVSPVTSLSTSELVIDAYGFPFRVDMFADNDDPNPVEYEAVTPNDQRITLTGGCEVCSYPNKISCFFYDPTKIEQMPVGFYEFLYGFNDAFKIELNARIKSGRKTDRFRKRAWTLPLNYFWDFEDAEEAIKTGWATLLSELR